MDAISGNVSAKKALISGMKQKPGKTFTLNGRTYQVGELRGTKYLLDVNDPNLVRTTYREIVDSIQTSNFVVRRGIPRAPAYKDLLTQNVNTLKRAGGYTDEQVSQLARQKTEQTLSSQANKVAQTLDNSASIAQRASAFRNTPELQRIASSKNVFTSAKDVVQNKVEIQSQANVIRNSGVAPKVLPVRAETLTDDVNRLKVNVESAKAKGRIHSSLFERYIGPLLVITAVVVAISLFVTLGPKLQSAAGMPMSAADASTADVDMSQLTPAQRQEAISLTDDFIQVTFFQMAVDHRNFLNGCFLHDKIEGTLKKVKVLSCGSVVVDNAMETCSMLGNYTSMQSWKDSCPENTFVPCLNETCTSIVYNGAIPNVASDVTKENACPATDNDDTPCSTFCRADAFALPEHQELICVNVDQKTAYVDLMDALGYNTQEMFPSVPPRRTLNQTTKIIFIVLLLGGVGAIGWMWYQRRQRQAF
jgi:hypothetical protein